jgi:hypothetical protein
MKRTFTVHKPTEVNVEYPDYYEYDDTLRGKIVDAIVWRDEHTIRKYGTVRDRLFDTEMLPKVKDAIRELEEAYEVADRILSVLEKEKS